MSTMKPYRKVPINDCGEPLVQIPLDRFAFFDPHPYASLGAPYGRISPWMLRKSVLDALENAQKNLEKQRKNWKIKLFDAYRPNSIQSFMVEREFAIQAQTAGLDPAHLTHEDRIKLGEKVYRIWGIPSEDPATPPPHSTGAAVDCTLVDETGGYVDMGSPIDENSDRSNPDYFSTSFVGTEKLAHTNRVLLYEIMCTSGFRQLATEWWHFSIGDQYWAWSARQQSGDMSITARYGRV